MSLREERKKKEITNHFVFDESERDKRGERGERK